MGLSSSRYSHVYDTFLDQGYVNSNYGLVEFSKVIMFKLGPKEWGANFKKKAGTKGFEPRLTVICFD